MVASLKPALSRHGEKREKREPLRLRQDGPELRAILAKQVERAKRAELDHATCRGSPACSVEPTSTSTGQRQGVSTLNVAPMAQPRQSQPPELPLGVRVGGQSKDSDPLL